MKVRRALLSVHDKTGVVELARALASFGVELLSTGGTAQLLRQAGLQVREVADVTGAPEMLGGRVKTLHPKIHGGILARRDVPEDVAALERDGIPAIDLVVVALYPFEATIAQSVVTRAEAIEMIDVGGPAMIRAAAKNAAGVAVLTHPSQYAGLIAELRASGGAIGDETRARLAGEAFARTAAYDAAIAAYLTSPAPSTAPSAGHGIGQPGEFPAHLRLDLQRVRPLKYGENPHQSAAFYRVASEPALGLGTMRALDGPELGYNNLLDLSTALAVLVEFDEPAAVVVKHTNPCGVGLGADVGEAIARAKASDPVSIYGGIVGVNRTVDMKVVQTLAGVFVELLFAPSFAPDALEELRRTKKKCRVVEVACDRRAWPPRLAEYRSVLGGMLMQCADLVDVDGAQLRCVTRRQPTAAEHAALRFAWRVAKHVKSNAIVLASAEQVIGIGAGQMNRVDSARLAVMRARELGLPTERSVCASDAFFPFRDGLDVVATAGASAAIQPGGSLRDDEVIAAADEHGMAMLFTGLRHFRH